MPGFDDQLANRPALGVHHEIADVADGSIARPEMVSVHGLRAPQMRIGSFGLRAIYTGSLARREVSTGSSKIGNPLMPHSPSPCQ